MLLIALMEVSLNEVELVGSGGTRTRNPTALPVEWESSSLLCIPIPPQTLTKSREGGVMLHLLISYQCPTRTNKYSRIEFKVV